MLNLQGDLGKKLVIPALWYKICKFQFHSKFVNILILNID